MNSSLCYWNRVLPKFYMSPDRSFTFSFWKYSTLASRSRLTRKCLCFSNLTNCFHFCICYKYFFSFRPVCNCLSQNFWHIGITIKTKDLFRYWLMFIQKFHENILKMWITIDGMFLEAFFKVFIKRIDVKNYIILKQFYVSFYWLTSQSRSYEATVTSKLYEFLKEAFWFVKIKSIKVGFIDWKHLGTFFKLCKLNIFINTPKFLFLTVKLKSDQHNIILTY